MSDHKANYIMEGGGRYIYCNVVASCLIHPAKNFEDALAEIVTLREQLQFATSELTAAKLVVEAAGDVVKTSGWRDGSVLADEIQRHFQAETDLKKALKVYGSQFPGSEEK